jgi:small subunit ribosomal protein S5
MNPRNQRRDPRPPRKKEDEESLEDVWTPKTELGKQVKSGEITSLDQILLSGRKILEPEIIDFLLPDLETDLILIGQSKGKFGGGKRRALRQTQKKTKQGNKMTFTALAVVGNRNGYLGVGVGKSKETRPATEKATKDAKINISLIGRGCGSWECGCGEPHSLPFNIESRASSVRVKMMPAPKGTGLVVQDELKKLMTLAGIKDVWSKNTGQTRKRINHVIATFEALKETSKIRVKEDLAKCVSLGETSK